MKSTLTALGDALPNLLSGGSRASTAVQLVEARA